MKIAIIQTKPVTGDVESNITDHKRWIGFAAENMCDLIVFPELSLTGYEPKIAQKIAINAKDKRLDIFKKLSDKHQITISAGIPTKTANRIHISQLLFQPDKKMKVYSKKYLHPDELSFFTPGENATNLSIHGIKIAFAICYELSVEEHLEKTMAGNPDIYVASVAKFKNDMRKAKERLSRIAKENKLTVFMSNSVGPADSGLCGGNSAIWDSDGILIKQLDNKNEGVLIFDTKNREAMSQTSVI